MYKYFISAAIVLSATACRDDSDHKKAPETVEPAAVETPKPMPIDPALKSAFIAECQSAAEDSTLGKMYFGLLNSQDTQTCAGAFDHFAKTRDVSIGRPSIVSLAPLAHLPFIESLHVVGPVTQELGKLAPLKNLQVISFGLADVQDVSFLKAFKHIRYVSIWETPVKSVASLATLPALNQVNIQLTADSAGRTALAKDEAHCPVKSANEALNAECRRFRGIE